MHYLLEAIIIGLYSSIIYLPISLVKLNIIIELFIIGFIKHYFGYYLKIHNYYCKKNKKRKALNKYLITDSIIEGILFIIFGYFTLQYFNIKIIGYFIIGIILHIFMEYINMHRYFIKYRCI